MSFGWEAAALLTLMAIHIASRELRFLEGLPRSKWLSAAGGISVAYVLVHLLPELAAGQAALDETEGFEALDLVEEHVYMAALAGLGIFYAIESAGRGGGRLAEEVEEGLRIGAFAVYNAVIGYLIIHREDDSVSSLIFFTIALGVHFVVNDHALRERHPRTYDRVGRWILVAGVAIGWTIGELTEISEAGIGLLVGFLAGGVILNVFKEELPSERKSSVPAFLIAAAAYAALLQLA